MSHPGLLLDVMKPQSAVLESGEDSSGSGSDLLESPRSRPAASMIPPPPGLELPSTPQRKMAASAFSPSDAAVDQLLAAISGKDLNDSEVHRSALPRKLRSDAPAFQPARTRLGSGTQLSSRAPAFQSMFESSSNFQPTWMEAWPQHLAYRNRTAAIPASMQAGIHGDTLKMHFQTLQTKDPGQVLIARKLNHLGFESPAVLKQHFSVYGTVEEVLVTHSRVRCHSSASGVRTRPASFGFIVMGSVDEAKMILAQGSLQTVQGVTVSISPFEQRSCGRGKSMSEDGDQKEGDDEATATGTSSATSVTGEDEAASERDEPGVEALEA
jgi:hypothetical protein